MRNRSSVTTTASPKRPRKHEEAQARVILLALGFFLLGIAATMLYFHAGRDKRDEQQVAGGQASGLSAKTEAVLQKLNTPVQIRFYSLLDRATVATAVKDFAARMDDLLQAYGEAGHDKIEIVRVNTLTETNADAASDDGLRPFNRDKGEPSFLGFVVSGNGQKVVLAQLSPEWEAAVQFDLTRAIDEVNRARPPIVAPAATRSTPEVLSEVKAAIPNLDAVSSKQGAEMLRAAALREFAGAANQLQAKVKEAQERLAAAQNSDSAEEQQAAMKNLQQVQAEQAEKVKEIAARLQEQIAALQQIKGQ
ncbi:hypothetical protein GC207_09295 [bacterium]|nr:hypothetical protein [bacterium]